MDATVGVYVHVPFCERVCPYCDFAVTAARPLQPRLEERYVEALIRELDARAGAYAGRRLESVYLGGGTPSLLRPASIARILVAVRAAFPDAAPIETTLEVNPSTLERERLPGFRDAGVDRVSVGVQSFDDTILRRLGRAHRAEEARRTLAACRAAGFGALSLDVIFAAPGQRLAGFCRDLDEAIGFGPDHVSTYELTIEPGTPFATADARRQLDRPGEEESVAMLEAAETRLGAAGFSRYELSSYARPGFESVHNRRYWQRRPVLGLGVGAFSSDPPREGAPHGQRRSNVRDVATYLKRLEAGESPEAAPPEVFSAVTARGEAVFLALRAAPGIDAAGFEREFGAPPRAYYGPTLDALCDEGLICEGPGGDFWLTERGRLLSDSVFERFV